MNSIIEAALDAICRKYNHNRKLLIALHVDVFPFINS